MYLFCNKTKHSAPAPALSPYAIEDNEIISSVISFTKQTGLPFVIFNKIPSIT
jgi:hypothetical protein